jgi:beta-glucuronidase
MLRPLRNRHRDTVDLCGIWSFRADPEDQGESLAWHQSLPEQAQVAVPGSFNEQLESLGLMHYVGAFWLSRKIFVPLHYAGQAISVYFGSADYHAKVWVNGQMVGEHDLPFLPFELDVTPHVKPGEYATITARLDTRLSHDEPLMGVTQEDYKKENRLRDEIYPAVRFDFFPYGGIHRPPSLCAKPLTHIEHLQLSTDTAAAGAGVVSFSLACVGNSAQATVHARLLDAKDQLVAQTNTPLKDGACSAQLHIKNCHYWGIHAAYLYRLELDIMQGETCVDSYHQAVGVRRIEVKGHQIKLNGQAIAMRGFGMHEDFASLGKGQCLAVTMRDLELLQWAGANTLRTSHYPYAEETLDLADQRGLLVISELACVNLDFRKLSDKLLSQHQKTLKAQIERDAKHPSVIMWSIANEPGYLGEPEYKEKSGEYWRVLVKTAKELDPTRPVTTANVDYATRDDPAFEVCDVVCINRYYGWYNMPGQLDRALKRMDEELEYVSRHGKPVIVTEFGADAIAGMHSISDQLFTEEYQAKFTEGYIRLIESKPYCAGVLVWNFADFRTAQHFRRVIVNRKGMFTRDRSPKAAAFKLKETWGKPRQIV